MLNVSIHKSILLLMFVLSIVLNNCSILYHECYEEEESYYGDDEYYYEEEEDCDELLFSDDDDEYYYEEDECGIPSDCITEEPFYGWLNINLTINSKNPTVLLKVFYGNYEDGYCILSDIVNQSHITYELTPGYYSATAQYISGQDTILAVYGDEIEIDSTEECDTYCWEIENGELDLRL